MNKTTLGLASAVLLAATLTACSDSGDYCDTLKESQAQFSDLNFALLSEDQFNDLRDQISTLEEQAPSEVSDDWAIFGDQIDEFKSLLDEAGIGLEDIKTLQQGKLPEGVDRAKLEELAPRFQELQSDPRLEEAQQAIKDSAKSECDITLGE